MKKYIYILLLAFATTFIATSCSDEEITPQTDEEYAGGTGNGTGSHDPIKN